MKKRLLIMFAAALGAVNSFAYEVGQYVYTENGRFMITGANMVKNGDFSNGLEGWTNFGGTALSPDTFEISANGPEGRNCMAATLASGGAQKSNGFATSTNFMQTVQLAPNGSYIVTYKTKAYTLPRISSVSLDRNGNYQNVFVNGDGSWPVMRTDEHRAKIKQSLYSFGTCTDTWQERVTNYTAGDSVSYMNIFFFNLVPGDAYADFGIYEVKQVGDDRKLQDAVNMIEFVINDRVNFPNGDDMRAQLEGIVSEMKGMIGSPIDVNSMEDMLYNVMETEESPYKAFLAANSADVATYYKNFTFNDAAIAGANKGLPSGWTSSTGTDRWGVSAPTLNLTTNHIFGEINASYGLSASTAYQGVSLPAGKYLYIVRGLGYKYFQDGSGNSSNFYHKDHYSPVEGMKFFMNNDTIDMENVGTEYANVYMHVFDVKEDGMQTIGFVRPATDKCETAKYDGNSGGGRISFDNVEIRAIGKTDADILDFYYRGTLDNERGKLQTSIDVAKAAVADKQYLFETATINDSIAVAEKTLAEATAASQENIDIVIAQTSNLDKALRAYKRINTEYTQLYNDIATCNAELADENRPKGKDVFGAAIKVAEDYINAQTETSRDSAAIMYNDALLMDARTAYQLANASILTPGEIALVNNSFQKGNATGWTEDGGASTPGKSNWKFSAQADFTDGYCAYFNRGRTATDYKWAWQDVNVENNGVYMYVAECAVNNSSWTDTTDVHSDTYLFVNNDSIEVKTPGTGNGTQDYPGNVTKFSITVKIADINALETPGVIRVGLEKPMRTEGAVQLGLIYFGSSHLYYLGSIEDYETGITDVNASSKLNNGDIYTINGVKVRANANSLRGLEKGIYIMNGKKYVVK